MDPADAPIRDQPFEHLLVDPGDDHLEAGGSSLPTAGSSSAINAARAPTAASISELMAVEEEPRQHDGGH